MQQQTNTAAPALQPSVEMDLEGVSSSYKSHLAEKFSTKQQFENEAMGLAKRLQTNPFYHSWNCALDVERLRGHHHHHHPDPGHRHHHHHHHHQPSTGVRASWSGGS
jgi:hypothetical protein